MVNKKRSVFRPLTNELNAAAVLTCNKFNTAERFNCIVFKLIESSVKCGYLEIFRIKINMSGRVYTGLGVHIWIMRDRLFDLSVCFIFSELILNLILFLTGSQ